MQFLRNLFAQPQSRRAAELAYLAQSVSRYDLERREREIDAGKFAGY